MKVFLQNRNFKAINHQPVGFQRLGIRFFIWPFWNYVADASLPFGDFYRSRFQKPFLKFCKSFWEFWRIFQHHRVPKIYND